MKIYKDIEQGTDDWMNLRLGKFTATYAQAVSNNGKGLESLVFTKVAERLTKKVAESYSNGDMERGKQLESLGRGAYEIERGVETEQVGFVELSDWVGCSPDSLIGEDGLLEVKCKNDANFVKYLYDKKIDSAHVWQMQAQLYITGRKWVDYAIYNPNFPNPIDITRVNRDEEKIEKLRIGLEKGIELAEQVLSKI